MERLNEEQYQELLDKMQVITEYFVMQIPEIAKNLNYQIAFENSYNDDKNKKFTIIKDANGNPTNEGVFLMRIFGDKSEGFDDNNSLVEGASIKMQVNYENLFNGYYNGEKIKLIVEEKLSEEYSNDRLKIRTKIYSGKVSLENNKYIFDYEHYNATEVTNTLTGGGYFDSSDKQKSKVEKEVSKEINNLYELALLSQEKKKSR